MVRDPEPSQPTARTPAFFSATCHQPLSRRQWLVGSGAALLAHGAQGGAALAAPDDGRKLIDEYATVPGDPWAVAHGIRAMGREFTLRDGRRAVDHLLENVLTSLPANGKETLGFQPDVEGHADAFLKTLLEAGVPLAHAFTHRGKRRTLADLVDGARARFRPQVVGAVANALPWSLIALTRTTSPVRPQWTNGWGEPVNLDGVVENALGLLERASLPLVPAMQAGRPPATTAPVHAFTCGGTHMLYALLTAVDAGFVGTNRAERVRRQVDLMVWRLGADIELIERFYAERARHLGAGWYTLDAKLKLLGHAEECLALAVRQRLVTLSESQEARRRAAVRQVRRMLDDLAGRGLDEAKALGPELFRQLVGDVCHARHGLTLA